MPRGLTVVTLGVLALAAGGCGTGAGERDAGGAVEAFWEKTLENWQSEFLAVGSMSILAVYLRQRGSPESKPVGASHESTGRGG